MFFPRQALVFVELHGNICKLLLQYIEKVTGVLQELETICLKTNPRERVRLRLTRGSSSQTSVTPGLASILFPFLLLLSPASALLTHAFASHGRVQEKM